MKDNVWGELMAFRIPEVRPISELARDARALVERARERQEPIIITQRGRDVAVLVPIELYRRMEEVAPRKVTSPRLVRAEDVEHFRMEMTVRRSQAGPDAGI